MKIKRRTTLIALLGLSIALLAVLAMASPVPRKHAIRAAARVFGPLAATGGLLLIWLWARRVAPPPPEPSIRHEVSFEGTGFHRDGLWVASDDGVFRICNYGRETIVYRQGDREIHFHADSGPDLTPIVFLGGMEWRPPHQHEMINPEQAEQIRTRFQAAMRAWHGGVDGVTYSNERG